MEIATSSELIKDVRAEIDALKVVAASTGEKLKRVTKQLHFIFSIASTSSLEQEKVEL